MAASSRSSEGVVAVTKISNRSMVMRRRAMNSAMEVVGRVMRCGDSVRSWSTLILMALRISSFSLLFERKRCMRDRSSA